MSVSISIETITPKWAKEEMQRQEEKLLEGVYRQRKLNASTVKRYAADMKMGHWCLNNQGIGYDDNENLIDGRHRLWAVVEAGVPVKMLVMRGLENIEDSKGFQFRTQDTIDFGRARTIPNQLQIDGVKNSVTVAAMVRCMGIIAVYPSKVKVGMLQSKQIVELMKESIEKTIETIGIQSRGIPSGGLSAIALYHDLKPRKAFEYLRDFRDMSNLPLGSPVIALRRYLGGVRQNYGWEGQRSLICATLHSLLRYDQNDNSVTHLRGNNVIGLDWIHKVLPARMKQIQQIVGFEEKE